MSRAPHRAASESRHVLRDIGRFGLTPAQLRSLVEGGFVKPRLEVDGSERFSFAEIKLLRVIGGLLAEAVPLGRVLEALRRLRQQLGDDATQRVSLVAHGGAVVAWVGSEAWDAETGQRLLDFVPPTADDPKVVRFTPRPAVPDDAPTPDQLDADAWFEHGCELEELGDPAAEEAYRKALHHDPEHTDALLNLGRWLHETGDLSAAEGLYRRALGHDPNDGIAAFNLGVALQDLERIEESTAAYLHAIQVDPNCADAYYNVAGLYQDRGDEVSALRYYKRYRALVD